jgi:hypothetical protein
MKTQLRNLLAISAVALGAAAITAPAAAADPQECLQSSPGVHECTSPGHAQIHVPPPAPPNYPNYQGGGPRGGPPHLPWIG